MDDCFNFSDLIIREEFRRDGLAACFRADPILISLFLNCFEVKIINVGFPSISEREREICRNIIDLNADFYTNVEFCLSGNLNEYDLNLISTIINDYQNTSAAIWLPASKHFLKNSTLDEIISKAEGLIKIWRGKSEKPIDIALADITDNNIETKLITAWIEKIFSAGARNIILCDTKGIGTFDNLEKLLNSINNDFHNRIEYHAHNDNDQGINNINFLYKKFNIKRYSSSIYGLSERGSLIDTQLLATPLNTEAFNSFNEYFQSSLSNPQEIIKSVYPKGKVLTGAQYRLYDQNDALELSIGVTSNKEVASKVLKRKVSNDELSYLKDVLLYDRNETYKICEDDINKLVSKEYNVIQQYIEDVKPEYSALNKFYDNTFKNINISGNEVNIVCLGAGLGLYLVPILSSIINSLHEKQINLYLFDKNFYYLLFTKYLFNLMLTNDNSKTDISYNNLLKGFSDNELKSNDLDSINISDKLTLHFYRKDIEANNFFDSLSEITNSQTIDIVHAPAFFHHLKNPTVFITSLIEKIKPGYLISSITLGDWLLFTGMFDDYKLYTPREFFDNSKLKIWHSIYNNLDFSFLFSSLRYQTVFLQNGRIPFHYTPIVESDFLTQENKTNNCFDLLQTWISNQSRSLFQLMPEEIFTAFKKAIIQHKDSLLKMNFIHLGKLVSVKIEEEVKNDYYKTINEISLYSETDVSNLFRRTSKFISDVLFDKLQFLIILPYLSHKGSRWFAELGSMYIRNDKSWKISNNNLISAILASVVRTKICSGDLTTFLFKDLIKHFNLPFFIKIVLLRESKIPRFEVKTDTSSSRYITIIFKLDYKPSYEILGELAKLKRDILNENFTSVSLLIDEIQNNKGQLTYAGLTEFIKLIDIIKHDSFASISNKIDEIIPNIQCEIDPSVCGFLYDEFSKFFTQDRYKKYLISLPIFLEYKVLLGLSKQQAYFKDKVGGVISWIYLKEELAAREEPLLFQSLIDLLAMPSDKITTYDYLKIISQHQTKTALIAILIDSYAHNISAHSLAALKWWFELRQKILGQRFFVPEEGLTLSKIEPNKIIISKDITQTSAKYYEDLGLTDGTYNNEFYSLYDFLQFSQDNLQKLFCFTESDQEEEFKKNDSKINGIVSSNKINPDEKLQCFNPQFPVSLDFALYPFFRFLRDKGAFWSGVTRDISFGGESKTWYKILWEDFANNPLFLGTIAKSEGITKLNIYLSYLNENNWETKQFISIDLSLIDAEESIANNLTPKNDKQPGNNYDKYAFIRLGTDFSQIRKIFNSEKYTVFLPGGIVGEHSLFTIFENTLRNIKHYCEESTLSNIKENGIDLHIAINNEELKFEEQVPRSAEKSEELFKVTVWLGHPTNMKTTNDEKLISLWEKVTNSTRQPIIDKNGNPRMGGNTQDKACAAMLFNNRFNSVDQQEGKYSLYFPWVHFTTNEHKAPKNDQEQPDQPLTRINCSTQNDYLANANNYKANISYSKGYLKKHFFMWRSADYFIVKNQDDLHGENISRFRFVIVDNPEQKDNLVSEARQEGVVRLIYDHNGQNISELINKLRGKHISRKDRLKLLYSTWIGIWLGELKSIEAVLNHNGNLARISFTENDVSLQRVRSFSSNTNQIMLLHGHQDEQNKCNIRSHGNFWTNYFSSVDNREPCVLLETIGNGQEVVGDKHSLYDFVEVVNTNVMIFDNRLWNRMPSDPRKVLVFKKQLKLNINEEISDDKKSFNQILENQISDYGTPHVLIMHLSYIESLGYNESKIGFMNHFIEKELRALIDSPNFIFIIISGRGRNSWIEELKPQYLRFTLFKPVESFLHAIESAISYNDNFDVKYNIIKVIFGS